MTCQVCGWFIYSGKLCGKCSKQRADFGDTAEDERRARGGTTFDRRTDWEREYLEEIGDYEPKDYGEF